MNRLRQAQIKARYEQYSDSDLKLEVEYLNTAIATTDNDEFREFCYRRYVVAFSILRERGLVK